jgi:hypothetical protein
MKGDQTVYPKSDIVAGMFMTKDATVIEPAKSSPTLSDIAERLERFRKKLNVVAQVVAANRRLH